MALHDKLAQKAIEMGKHSSEFSAAAQKHSNATWFYLIVAGIAWYFFGWLWALIPGTLGIYTVLQSISATMVTTRLESHESKSGASNIDFVQIVQAYGNTLETAAPTPGTVADANKLPYTKQQIKEAIVSALRSTDDAQTKEYLKIGYIQLSDWQEGVGESNQGLDMSVLDMSQYGRSRAKAAIAQSLDSEKWTVMAQKEQETLQQELQELGLW